MTSRYIKRLFYRTFTRKSSLSVNLEDTMGGDIDVQEKAASARKNTSDFDPRRQEDLGNFLLTYIS